MGLAEIGNKIFDKEVKLSSEEVQLGAIDDLNSKYKLIASKAPKIKAQILKLASELDGVADELDDLQSDYKRLEGMAKELGADGVESTAKTMFKTTGNLSSGWGKAAIGINSAAKKI